MNEPIDIKAEERIAPQPQPQAALTPIQGAKSKTESIAFGSQGIALASIEDAYRFAKCVIDSRLAPRGFDTPQAVLVAMQFGAELGLGPMASLQNIAIVNGRPTLWGDAVPAVCNATGAVESYKDEQIGNAADDTLGFRVTIQRKWRTEPIVRSFTVANAKRAGLWGKQGPWSQYPERMLLMRARTFAYRDAFPDALRGIGTVEESRDHGEPKNVTRSLDEFEQKKEVAA